ncbi:MAG: 30S ribosomal protein S6 [Acidimicrobiales bacterium]
MAVIFDVGLDENDIRATTDRVTELVRSHGGSVGRIDRWGRRTFAYELKHKTEGFYLFIEVVAEPAVIAEVGRMLALADEVLRHRIIRQPDRLAGRADLGTTPSDAQAS